MCKIINVIVPSLEELRYKEARVEQKLDMCKGVYSVFLLDRSRSWLLAPNDKLRKFGDMHRCFFKSLLNSVASARSRKELKKAYKKAAKLYK